MPAPIYTETHVRRVRLNKRCFSIAIPPELAAALNLTAADYLALRVAQSTNGQAPNVLVITRIEDRTIPLWTPNDAPGQPPA